MAVTVEGRERAARRVVRPKLSYLICATPRSGSTLLCEALTNTGLSGRPAEHFEVLLETGRPRRPRDYFQRSNDPNVWALLDDPEDWRPPDFGELLDSALEKGTMENGVFGTKIMWAYFRDFVRLARRSGRAGVAPCEVPASVFPHLRRYVWIRRHDTTSQAVSLWKALQTQQWRRDTDDELEGKGLRFSFTAVNHLKLRIDEHNAAWQDYFEECGIEPIKIVYEELAEDYEDIVPRLLFFVETPRMRRQADELSQEWVRLYNEARAMNTPVRSGKE